jgi:hypothetical protein
MTAEEFLENVLAEQAVETDSDEHANLIEEHDSIATLLARELAGYEKVVTTVVTLRKL